MMADFHFVKLAIEWCVLRFWWGAFHFFQDVFVFEFAGLEAILVHVLEA